MSLATDSASTEGDLPLTLGRVYAAELLFHLGEESSALEILDDAENSSGAMVRTEAGNIRKRLARNKAAEGQVKRIDDE